MCQALGVSRSGYYAWSARGPSKRAVENRQVVGEIRAIHQQSRHTYGSPRVHQELRAQGVCVGRHRVARLMRENGIWSVRKRKRRRTTDSNHRYRASCNLLARAFNVDRPHKVWASDLTYADRVDSQRTEDGVGPVPMHR